MNKTSISRPGTLEQNKTLRIEKPIPLRLPIKIRALANAVGSLLMKDNR